MATYSSLLRDWKTLSASRDINTQAFTTAGIVSMQTSGNQGIIDLAPLASLNPATIEHERRRFCEDATMVGLHITATALDARGTYHYRVTIERADHAG